MLCIIKQNGRYMKKYMMILLEYILIWNCFKRFVMIAGIELFNLKNEYNIKTKEVKYI